MQVHTRQSSAPITRIPPSFLTASLFALNHLHPASLSLHRLPLLPSTRQLSASIFQVPLTTVHTSLEVYAETLPTNRSYASTLCTGDDLLFVIAFLVCGQVKARSRKLRAGISCPSPIPSTYYRRASISHCNPPFIIPQKYSQKHHHHLHFGFVCTAVIVFPVRSQCLSMLDMMRSGLIGFRSFLAFTDSRTYSQIDRQDSSWGILPPFL